MALPTAASVISSGLAGYPTVYYDRVALDTLESNLFMYQACDLKVMPDMSGVAMQIFDYTAPGANTTPQTEGTPGPGQSLTQNTATINLANYVDYVSFSNKVVLTAISNTVAEGAALLSYRGALSVDTVISTAVDTQANSNASVDDIEVADGSYLTAAISRRAAWSLRSKNVKPKADGLFFGITHSLTAYDIVNDSTAAGFTDLQKFNDRLAPENPALAGIKGARIGNVGGVMFYESNAVPTETNWQSSAHNAYHSYVFGHQAFIASSLGKTNLNQKNFSVKVQNFPAGSNSLDPAGLIAAAAAYNFFFGVVAAPTPSNTDRFRRIRSESSIG
ncbi:MAG: N4-gp56 family major capsid protein [Candidatus Acidiferrales bacterium]